MGLLRISESVRVFGVTFASLTAQKAFLNNFENLVNREVDIREAIKRYQTTLSNASSKIDYSVGLGIYNNNNNNNDDNNNNNNNSGQAC